jgi:hypothetical protein
MSKIAFALVLTACTTGQVDSNYWQQWNQFGGYGTWDSWDWRQDPFARAPVYPRVVAPRPLPRPLPMRPAPTPAWPGRYRGPGPMVRQSLDTLAPDSQTLRSYRKAVDAMKKLPPEDPHSWVFQANIHGFPSTPNSDPLWGQCQHGNWWFLPWHRAHLYCFEKILRRYAEDPTFALPYWDYSLPSQRALPVPFRDPASPLYDDTRLASVNNGTDQLSATIVVDGANASMENTVFADFGPVTTFGGQAMNTLQHRGNPHGALEAVPHDLVHGFVGGNLGSVDLAARDPIFHCHHANVDRLWLVWLQMGQGRANSSNDVWLNQTFTFYDENKQRVTLSVRQLLDTSSLGYIYDRVGPPPPPTPTPPAPTPSPSPTPPAPTPSPTPAPPPSPPAPPPSPTPVPPPPTPPPGPPPSPSPTLPVPPGKPAPNTPVEIVARLNTSNVALQDRSVTLTMEIPASVRSRFNYRPGTRFAAHPNRILLQIDETRFRGVPDSVVAVYVNLPQGSPIPGPRSPHFAGYFTFFGDHHNEGYACQVDVTRQLQRVWQHGSDQPAAFTVTLVRTPPGTAPRDFRAPITFREMSLSATK